MSKATREERDEFFSSYLACLLWSSHDLGDNPEAEPCPLDENYASEDFSDETSDPIVSGGDLCDIGHSPKSIGSD